MCAYAAFGREFLYCEAYGWMYWTGTHWSRELAEQRLDLAITAMLKQRCKLAIDNGKEAIIKAAIPSARHIQSCRTLFDERVPASVDEFDADPDTINVANGVLNLRTGMLAPHDPKQRFTYCMNTPYDPAADYSQWTAFLAATVQGGTAILAYLQMAVGYSLTGYTSEECLWYIHGPARSGKGTFAETIMTLTGQPFSIETDFGTFTAQRAAGDQGFDLAPLKPARIVFASESNSAEWLNSGKVKRITGGNMISCSFKHRDQFTYRPRFKLWLTSNHPVKADVDDDAIWGRVKALQFPNGHLGEEDKSLKQKMKSPDNLRGVLRWAVEGAMAWFQSERGLVTPDEIKAITSRSRQQVDFVQSWLDENCVPVADGWVGNSDLYANYLAWCKANGVAPKQQRGLSMALQSKGYEVGVQKKIGDKNQKGVGGLGLIV